MPSEKPPQRIDGMQKRVTEMPDGRYLIYYTFPTIDKEFEKLQARRSEPRVSSDRKKKG